MGATALKLDEQLEIDTSPQKIDDVNERKT